MSLDIARLIAFSAISATEVQIGIASGNIANADTTNYTEETGNQVAEYSGGSGSGVQVTGIMSNVDQFLLKSLVGSTSDLGAADTTNNYMIELQQLFGTANTNGTSTTGTSIANTLASLGTALTQLSSTPSSVSAQAAVVSALDDVASQLRDTSSGIQNLRANADQDISSSVDSINGDLNQIASLNSQITQMTASGQSTAVLEDQRNSALQDLSSFMNVNYSTSSNGQMQIYTQSGQPLVDSSAHMLSHPASSNVSASTTSFGGIEVNGVDISSQITSGKVSALITMRDKTLPAEQSQLDQLANQLKSALNSVSNGASAVPAPTSLTGTATVSNTTALSATGTLRIAVTDPSGKLVSYQDLDLANYSTVGDLATAINAIPGASASVDANGHLTINSTNSADGIAINDMNSSIGGVGFSNYFGMNDLVTGTGASDFAVNNAFLSGAEALPTGTLDGSTPLTVGNQVLAPGSAAVINAFSSVLTGSTNFASAGGLNATTGSFTDYASAIVGNVASKASQAANNFTTKSTAQESFANSLSSEDGVNVDEESNRVSQLQNQYAAAAQLLSTINAMFSSLITAMTSS